MTTEPSRAPIARIDRVAVWTDELERLRDFFAHELGAQASPLYQEPAGGRLAVFLDFYGVGLELIEPAAGAGRDHQLRPGCAYIALALGSADAVDRLTERRRAAGRPVVEPPQRSWEGHYRAVAVDPDGNRVELAV